MLVVKVGGTVATDIVRSYKDEEYHEALAEFKSQTNLCRIVGQPPWIVELAYIYRDGEHIVLDQNVGFMTETLQNKNG